jgi:hypothetical protein
MRSIDKQKLQFADRDPNAAVEPLLGEMDTIATASMPAERGGKVAASSNCGQS